MHPLSCEAAAYLLGADRARNGGTAAGFLRQSALRLIAGMTGEERLVRNLLGHGRWAWFVRAGWDDWTARHQGAS